MSTVESVGATVSTCLRTRRRAALSPDDLLEIVLGADLLFQVGLFPGERSFSASISWKAKAFSTATATWLATSCRKPTSAVS